MEVHWISLCGSQLCPQPSKFLAQPMFSETHSPSPHTWHTRDQVEFILRLLTECADLFLAVGSKPSQNGSLVGHAIFVA